MSSTRLLHSRQSGAANQPLLETATKTFHCEYSKDRYEPCRNDLIAMFPETTRTVLSIGCGWGKTEAELAKRGIEVTAIPLDAMIGACAEARGVNVVYGTLENAIDQLRGRQFDGVLMSGILHLFPKPADALAAASSVLAQDGVLVATLPAFRRLPSRWERLRHPSRYKGWEDFQRSGMHALTRRQVRSWFRDAGLSLERVAAAVPKRWESVAWICPDALAEELFARQYTMVGRQTRKMSKPEQQAATLRSQAEPEVTYAWMKGQNYEGFCGYTSL